MMKYLSLEHLIEPALLRRAAQGLFPILSMTMHGGLVEQANKFKKRVASADTSQYKVVGRNQLVVGFPIDEGVLSFQDLYEEAVVSPAYDIWDLKNGEVIPRYLERYLRSPRALAFYAAKLRGTTARRRTLPDDIFLSLQVPLPTLSEQRRIAEVLDRAEALRAKRRVALSQLDTLTQSIFLDLFGDPTSAPKRWPDRPFGEVCQTRLGKMLDQKQQTGNHLRPYLRNANVQWFRFDLSEVFEMDFDADDREKFVIRNGDLLICEGGEPGRSAIWRGEIAECYYQKALHCARPHATLANPDYLTWLLWFLVRRGGLSDHVTSATIAHLTGEKLAAMRIPVPPLGLQREFARRLAEVEKLKTAHRASQIELDALFAVLQHRAFRGDL